MDMISKWEEYKKSFRDVKQQIRTACAAVDNEIRSFENVQKVVDLENRVVNMHVLKVTLQYKRTIILTNN